MTSAKNFGFFYPLPHLVTVTNQLILLLLSAFWETPPPTHFGGHIWKPPFSSFPAPIFLDAQLNVRGVIAPWVKLESSITAPFSEYIMVMAFRDGREVSLSSSLSAPVTRSVSCRKD